MAFWNRKKSAEQPKFESLTAQLNARLMPIDRGEFEDPLNEFLKDRGLGEVTGGGTQLADEPAGIEYCDIEIALTDPSEANIAAVVGFLEELGAPKGSKLHLAQRDPVPFGVGEGLALFLDGVTLPDEIYETYDLDQLVEAANERMALGGGGRFFSHWQGSRETGLYFYGPSFARMNAALEPLVATYPLCQGARIEQIA
jgi:hypothetical protein